MIETKADNPKRNLETTCFLKNVLLSLVALLFVIFSFESSVAFSKMGKASFDKSVPCKNSLLFESTFLFNFEIFSGFKTEAILRKETFGNIGHAAEPATPSQQ